MFLRLVIDDRHRIVGAGLEPAPRWCADAPNDGGQPRTASYGPEARAPRPPRPLPRGPEAHAPRRLSCGPEARAPRRLLCGPEARAPRPPRRLLCGPEARAPRPPRPLPRGPEAHAPRRLPCGPEAYAPRRLHELEVIVKVCVMSVSVTLLVQRPVTKGDPKLRMLTTPIIGQSPLYTCARTVLIQRTIGSIPASES